jgi:prepilin-type processing-associated H-X9-DG protein
VAVIIAIVLALLLPVYSASHSRTHQVVCAMHVRQIGMALVTYVIDNDQGHPPDASLVHGATWEDAVMPYVGDPHVFRCPTARHGLRDPLTGRPVSYGFHAMLGPVQGLQASWWQAVGERYSTRDWDAARTIVVADSRQSLIGHWRPDLLGIVYANAPDADFVARGLRPNRDWQRHPAGANVCFLDGHVKAYEEAELLRLVPIVGRP